MARRAFFFEFGKQAVTAIGQVAGMADIVGRSSSTAAASLLGLGEPRATPRTAVTPRSAKRDGSAVTPGTSGPAGADDAFRSPYRLVGNELLLLDQRAVPESLDEVTARRGSDVAYYLRIGVARGGPTMAQAAAYGLAMTAFERSGQPFASRDVELRRTRRALSQARPSSRLPAWAMERMQRLGDRLGEGVDGPVLAQLLREEADAIAMAFQAQHSAIVAHLTELLPTPEGRPLSVLLHGDTGALSGGLVGTGLTSLQRLVQDGRELRIFVTETRPFMDGIRLASWQLRQAGLEHKIITDSAVAWLLAREPIDAILLGADWIAANGDAAGVIGSRAIVQQAAAAIGRDGAGPMVVVCAVSATIDLDTADGSAIPVELRPARDMAAYLADVPVRAADSLVPATDVMPGSMIGALVTERGVVRTPSVEAIARHLVDVPPERPD